MHFFSWRAWLELLRETVREWQQDDCLQLGAALSYYTIFSLAPLLVVTIAIVALVFGDQIAQGEVLGRVESLVGPDAAAATREMIERASEPRAGILATLGGLAMTALGASGVFGQLQRALNKIWNVERASGRGVRGLVLDRLSAFSMLLLVGFLLMISLGAGAALAALSGRIAGLFPGAGVATRLGDLITSFAVTTLLFALLFKVLPDVKVRWSDVIVGAAFTALLFALGRLAISTYLGRTSGASIYGAASSLVVLLLWVYYSSQLLFFGAEFTQVYTRRYGSLRKEGS
ncbi:MAG: YihY/virulence factor BrkB family protein [Myxococcota bacterium]